MQIKIWCTKLHFLSLYLSDFAISTSVSSTTVKFKMAERFHDVCDLRGSTPQKYDSVLSVLCCTSTFGGIEIAKQCTHSAFLFVSQICTKLIMSLFLCESGPSQRDCTATSYAICSVPLRDYGQDLHTRWS